GLITVAATGGVAHPPGYPLYTMLAGAWLRLFPLGNVAWRVDLFSAVCAAAAAAVLALAVVRASGSRSAALFAAWTFALATPMWRNAVVAEVFALHALLAACMLLALVCALVRPPDAGLPNAPVAALALLGTLALSHHHTLVLLALPAFLVALV